MNTIKDLLKVNPDTLRKEQYKALKEHAIKVLNEVQKLLRGDNLDNILNQYLSDSPAGDGMGLDNHFINFDFEPGNIYGNDLHELIVTLKELSLTERSK